MNQYNNSFEMWVICSNKEIPAFDFSTIHPFDYNNRVCNANILLKPLLAWHSVEVSSGGIKVKKIVSFVELEVLTSSATAQTSMEFLLPNNADF